MLSTRRIKQYAKVMKKSSDLTHSQCLDQIIKYLGFTSWNHYCAGETLNETKENELHWKQKTLQEKYGNSKNE